MKTQNFFFRMKDDQNKDLNYWKENCKDDYLHTPISVLRYITELENKVNNGVLDDVKECSHPFNKVVSGDEGDFCTECKKYLKTNRL